MQQKQNLVYIDTRSLTTLYYAWNAERV